MADRQSFGDQELSSGERFVGFKPVWNSIKSAASTLWSSISDSGDLDVKAVSNMTASQVDASRRDSDRKAIEEKTQELKQRLTAYQLQSVQGKLETLTQEHSALLQRNAENSKTVTPTIESPVPAASPAPASKAEFTSPPIEKSATAKVAEPVAPASPATKTSLPTFASGSPEVAGLDAKSPAHDAKAGKDGWDYEYKLGKGGKKEIAERQRAIKEYAVAKWGEVGAKAQIDLGDYGKGEKGKKDGFDGVVGNYTRKSEKNVRAALGLKDGQPLTVDLLRTKTAELSRNGHEATPEKAGPATPTVAADRSGRDGLSEITVAGGFDFKQHGLSLPKGVTGGGEALPGDHRPAGTPAGKTQTTKIAGVRTP